MTILLTFDYELFFGTFTGTLQKSMLRPAEALARMAERHGIGLSFFADCGYLVRLEQLRSEYPELEADYRALTDQLKQLAGNGHDVQLHIHPHWEDTVYRDGNWIMNTGRYRLHQFSDTEIASLIRRYSTALFKVTGQPLHTFRAGGWCLQPFSRLGKILRQAGISIDSSVFPNGHSEAAPYYYDFRNCPDKDYWTFESDPLQEEAGPFTELPISSAMVSPLFFWKLYLLGRLNPSRHKPLGDGKPILSKGFKRRILTRYTRQVVTADGYNASMLQRQTDQLASMEKQFLVVLSHPKALSPYSIETLDRFVETNKDKHRFITFSAFKQLLPAE